MILEQEVIIFGKFIAESIKHVWMDNYVLHSDRGREFCLYSGVSFCVWYLSE